VNLFAGKSFQKPVQMRKIQAFIHKTGVWDELGFNVL
jgi:hypothetical protein